MSITINPCCNGIEGDARKYAQEMISSGLAVLHKKNKSRIQVERYVDEKN